MYNIQYYLQFQGQTRRIDLIVVFGITAFFSIFAYIWLLIILKWSSPEEVELWESILTFLFFPIMTVIAFCGDKGWLDFLKCQRSGSGSGSAGMSDKQRQIELGSFQPGESTYRTNFLCFSSMFLLWTRLEHFWPPSQIVSCFSPFFCNVTSMEFVCLLCLKNKQARSLFFLQWLNWFDEKVSWLYVLIHITQKRELGPDLPLSTMD